MNKQKSYHHPPTNPNFFSHTNYFFSVQLGHPKLSGYGLLSTQALQNRSQKYSSVSQSGATAFPWRDPGPPAVCRPKGVNTFYQYGYDLLSTIYIRAFGGYIMAIWAVAFIEICSSDPTFLCS